MYICSCNALTDADIRRAHAEGGAKRPAEMFAACRCRAQCGTCVRAVCAILGCGQAEASIQTVPVRASMPPQFKDRGTHAP